MISLPLILPYLLTENGREMKTKTNNITTLIDGPIQTIILKSLLDGRAYTAIEIANATDVSKQNIEKHLPELVDTNLLTIEDQGRHIYYRLSSPAVADSVKRLSDQKPKKKTTVKDNNSGVRYCRTCYDHLAGQVGVLIEDSLTSRGFIELQDKTYSINEKGNKFFSDFGLNLAELQNKNRNFAKSCLDWSERKHHLAGSLGNALLEKMLELDWVQRTKDSRAIIVTSLGKRGLKDKFKVEV